MTLHLSPNLLYGFLLLSSACFFPTTVAGPPDQPADPTPAPSPPSPLPSQCETLIIPTTVGTAGGTTLPRISPSQLSSLFLEIPKSGGGRRLQNGAILGGGFRPRRTQQECARQESCTGSTMTVTNNLSECSGFCDTAPSPAGWANYRLCYEHRKTDSSLLHQGGHTSRIEWDCTTGVLTETFSVQEVASGVWGFQGTLDCNEWEEAFNGGCSTLPLSPFCQHLMNFYQQFDPTKSTYYVCTNKECPFERRRNRRSLTISKNPSTFNGDEPELHHLMDKCKEYDYQGALFVDEHVHIIATPSEQARQAGCGYFVAVETVFDSLQAPPRKQLFVWDDEEAFQASFPQALEMGTFSGHSLLDAFDQADPSSDGGAYYEVFTTNCAKTAIQMAKALDIEIDGHITSYVARRLIEHSGKTLASTIRQSIHYLGSRSNLKGGSAVQGKQEDDDDRALIQLFVQDSANKLQSADDTKNKYHSVRTHNFDNTNHDE